MHIGALSVLLTATGDILIDFQDFINSIDDIDEEELLRRTSLLVQTVRLVSLSWYCLCGSKDGIILNKQIAKLHSIANTI